MRAPVRPVTIDRRTRLGCLSRRRARNPGSQSLTSPAVLHASSAGFVPQVSFSRAMPPQVQLPLGTERMKRPGTYRGRGQRRAASPAAGQGRQDPWTATGSASSGVHRDGSRARVGRHQPRPGCRPRPEARPRQSDTASVTAPPCDVHRSNRPSRPRAAAILATAAIAESSCLVRWSRQPRGPGRTLWNAINGSPRSALHGHGCGRLAAGSRRRPRRPASPSAFRARTAAADAAPRRSCRARRAPCGARGRRA